MSRGRHRHSSFLGRSLPPAATGVLVIAALAALVASPDQIVARSVGVAAVFAAIGLGMVLRQRDKAARAAAQLAIVQRLRAEERYEEQLAEAEYAAEVAEERATRFGRRLTAEKSRLAKAETEIARLLRERAVAVAEQALKEAEAARRALAASRPAHPVTPAAYVRAAAVLRQLERKAGAAEARRENESRAALATRPYLPELVAAGAVAPAAPAAPVRERAERPAVAAAPERPVLAAPGAVSAGQGLTPAATAAPGGAERQRPRPGQAGGGRGSGFSFFGRQGAVRAAAVRAAAPAPSVGDLADVVGDEALAASARYAVPPALAGEQPAEQPARRSEEAEPDHGRPEVVDLTPEDETELLELPELRSGRA
ncbi:hypothetical protein AB0D08_19490 [Kitasatospora sp. NPDC048540]|uniref:hypothetical protein n=1 Tax=Kitasatospora sp. NPDC048540 TaxID=3155634 RepID=UPI00340950B8